MAKPKNGTSKTSSRQRKALFVDAFIANGENGTRAAIEVGVPEAGAGVTAYRWLKDAYVQKLLERRRAELRAKFALTADRVMQEVARVNYFNPKRLVDHQGRAIPLHKLDDDTAAALASIEIIETEIIGKGKEKKVRVRRMKGRPFNKPTTLNIANKILRLYDKPPPPPPPEPGDEERLDDKETARLLAFMWAKGSAQMDRERAPAPAKRRKKVTIPG